MGRKRPANDEPRAPAITPVGTTLKTILILFRHITVTAGSAALDNPTGTGVTKSHPRPHTARTPMASE